MSIQLSASGFWYNLSQFRECFWGEFEYLQHENLTRQSKFMRLRKQKKEAIINCFVCFNPNMAIPLAFCYFFVFRAKLWRSLGKSNLCMPQYHYCSATERTQQHVIYWNYHRFNLNFQNSAKNFCQLTTRNSAHGRNHVSFASRQFI